MIQPTGGRFVCECCGLEHNKILSGTMLSPKIDLFENNCEREIEFGSEFLDLIYMGKKYLKKGQNFKKLKRNQKNPLNVRLFQFLEEYLQDLKLSYEMRTKIMVFVMKMNPKSYKNIISFSIKTIRKFNSSISNDDLKKALKSQRYRREFIKELF